MQDIEQLKYPAGKLHIPEKITQEQVEIWIKTIALFPKKVKTELTDLTNQQTIRYHYRAGGWNIKQVLNHCIDSHMNSFIRFKLALTEENPIIRPYDETAWAELPDTLLYDVSESIQLLQLIHKRWVFLLNSLTTEQFNRTFIHPDGDEVVTLKENLCIYAWHCENHFLHIVNAKKFKFPKD
ncbi:MAG: putative metal-dependent hydrolase [Flavobacteriaceae bacterium]|nr:putative metal-dependent hydrolase [Flavobacteriaceae bacterium]